MAQHIIPHKWVDEVSVDRIDISAEAVRDLACWCCLKEAHWGAENSLGHAVMQRL